MSQVVGFNRLVLDLSHGTLNKTVAQLAAEFAGLLGLDVHGLFLQDKGVLALGEFPFARELRPLEGQWLSIDADRLAADVEFAAQRARRRFIEIVKAAGANPIFEIVEAGTAMARASPWHTGDIVLLHEPWPPVHAAASSLTQLAENALETACSALLIPNRVLRRRGPIVAIATDPAESGIKAGLSIAEAASSDLVVVNLGAPFRNDWREAGGLPAAGTPVRVIDMLPASITSGSLLPLDPPSLKETLLVVTQGTLECSQAACLAEQRRVPVLIVDSKAC